MCCVIKSCRLFKTQLMQAQEVLNHVEGRLIQLSTLKEQLILTAPSSIKIHLDLRKGLPEEIG